MKKISILAIAAVMSLGLASCSIEAAQPNNGGAETRTTDVTIKIADEGTRAIGMAGTEVVANVNSGVIVIATPTGDLSFADIVPTEIMATAGGQVVTDVVLGSEVFVIANLPTQATQDGTANTPQATSYLAQVKALTTMADVKAFTLNVKNVAGVALNAVPLANSTDTFVALDDTLDSKPGEEELAITLRPIIARIELTKTSVTTITDTNSPNFGKDVSAYTVKGIYLADFNKGVTLSGNGNGVKFPLSSPVVTQELTDVVANYGQGDVLAAGWAAGTFGTPTDLDARPAVSSVWHYNIAGSTTPYFVVEIDGVALSSGETSLLMPDGNHADLTLNPKFYLTVSSYGVASFLPGNIYNIADLEFTTDHLGTAPTGKVDLTVKVTVSKWVVNSNITANL